MSLRVKTVVAEAKQAWEDLPEVDPEAVLRHLRGTNPYPHNHPRDAIAANHHPCHYVWRGPVRIEPGDARIDWASVEPHSKRDVERYRKSYLKGSEFPAILLTKHDGDLFRVSDGAHRLKAAMELGVPIDAFVGWWAPKPKAGAAPDAKLTKVLVKASASLRLRAAAKQETPAPEPTFHGLTRAQWLGDGYVSNYPVTLKPSADASLKGVEAVSFLKGRYTAKFGPKNAAVFDGKKVVASYDFGNVLLVAGRYPEPFHVGQQPYTLAANPEGASVGSFSYSVAKNQWTPLTNRVLAPQYIYKKNGLSFEAGMGYSLGSNQTGTFKGVTPAGDLVFSAQGTFSSTFSDAVNGYPILAPTHIMVYTVK